MRIEFRLKSPLSHSAFTPGASGNVTALRRFPIMGSKGVVKVPAVSGNAIRANVRRNVMREMFQHLGVRGDPGFAEAYGLAANGGYLDGFDNAVDPVHILAVRESCPPLSVLGSAMGKYMLPGRVKFGILWPVCDATVDAGVCDDSTVESLGDFELPKLDEIESEIHHTRLPDREFTGTNEAAKPMPHGFETINAGVRLVGSLKFSGDATEIEQGAVWNGLMDITHIGGKSGSGMGEVELIDPCFDLDLKKPLEAYEDWLAKADKENVMRYLYADKPKKKSA